jgi:hypothetical protein
MTTTRSAVIGMVFLLGCAVGGASSRLAVPQARAGANPTRWEYHCIDGTAELVPNSNKMGEQGWEMVAGAGAGSSSKLLSNNEFVWCFKRAVL